MKQLVLAAFLLLPGIAVAQAATIDGTWRIDGDVSGNPVAPVCILTAKEGKVTGTCTGTDGKPMQVSGTVKDDAISWAYDTTYQGGTITLSFKGKQDKEGHMVGSIDVAPYSATGDFTAKRDVAAAKP